MKGLLKSLYVHFLMMILCLIPVKCGINKTEKREKRIIVSLTSYPERFYSLYYSVKSLLLQSVKPDKVVLYLGEDSAETELPKRIRKLTKAGLSVEYKAGNLKSHKKYFYAMQEYPEDLIILADDDMIFEPGMIARLMKSYKKYPDAVSARRVHRIARNEDGTTASYNNWEYECTSITIPGNDLFATTGFGALLPPHCMDELTTDSDLFMDLCGTTDDVWLKFMQLAGNTPTVYVPNHVKHLQRLLIPQAQTTSLSLQNVDDRKNDVCIHNMEKYMNRFLGEYSSLVYHKDAGYRRLKK